ncbi:LOW QUALITY PROTEIN: hypothetical protein TorRG33x02_047420 [Trema orientale]|uniref:Uncharacterized protein n=1 Tax=Trema orientale TaxID=63057 RepID=A0A2P5FP55_TREOI|nr:LOW QUALITY PROTEIN: hypothetical protein TorRG33x02_047420 [Trema orientale]
MVNFYKPISQLPTISPITHKNKINTTQKTKNKKSNDNNLVHIHLISRGHDWLIQRKRIPRVHHHHDSIIIWDVDHHAGIIIKDLIIKRASGVTSVGITIGVYTVDYFVQ